MAQYEKNSLEQKKTCVEMGEYFQLTLVQIRNTGTTWQKLGKADN